MRVESLRQVGVRMGHWSLHLGKSTALQKACAWATGASIGEQVLQKACAWATGTYIGEQVLQKADAWATGTHIGEQALYMALLGPHTFNFFSMGPL